MVGYDHECGHKVDLFGEHNDYLTYIGLASIIDCIQTLGVRFLMLDALKEGGWWISRELFYVIRKRMRNGVRKERKEDEERIIELQLKGMQKWARDKREIERRDGMGCGGA